MPSQRRRLVAVLKRFDLEAVTVKSRWTKRLSGGGVDGREPDLVVISGRGRLTVSQRGLLPHKYGEYDNTRRPCD